MNIELAGRIDSQNASDAEKDINTRLAGYNGEITLDAENLDYISSAGLRIILRLRRSKGNLRIINPSSFSKILATEPDKMDWCVKEYIELLKLIHSTVVPEGKLPDIKTTALEWAKYALSYLPEKYGQKLVSMLEAVPHDDHMIHGDYHTKNVMLQNGEVLLIDMDTLSVGYPIFELAQMYSSFIGFYELDHEAIRDFQGFEFATGRTFWQKSLAAYLGTNCKSKLREVEDKARIVSLVRLIRDAVLHGEANSENVKKVLDYRVNELIKLLERVDSLTFDRNELEVEADAKNLSEVQEFIDERLEACCCPDKAKMQIAVAVEEIFVNIANYAYAPEKGKATVRAQVSEQPISVTVTFMDNGTPFDPIAKADPDVTLSADERDIGGLGIFMAKKIMDDVSYEYKDGRNILTLKKKLI